MSLVTIPNMRRAASPFSSLKLNFTLNALDSRINFSRTTNATVTNSAGQITYAPHNLLTHSEQFDNAAWITQQGALSTNQTTAPNGTQTADKYVGNTVNTSNHRIVRSFTIETNTTYTLSCYIKKAGWSYVAISTIFDGSAFYKGVRVNLDDGTFTNIGTPISASVTNVGDNWYRVSVTVPSVGTSGNIYLIQSGPSINDCIGNDVDGFFIWGAQLEIGSTATTYNPTTVKNLLGYSELFDNAAWTKSNSFVQTNLLTYSEAFDNAVWTKTGATITANDAVAPNGYQTADKLVETTAASASHWTNFTSTLTATSYTLSVYLKAGERIWTKVACGLAGTPNGVFFNLSTGAIGTSDAGYVGAITPLANGWYRCSITFTATAAVYYPAIRLATADNVLTYTGDGTSGAYLWGAQLVQGSVAGDYRRTDAAALPVYYPNHNGVVCAEKLVENTVNTQHFIDISSPLSSTCTLSVYAKAGERAIIYLYAGAAGGKYFNLSTGTIGSDYVATPLSSSITAVGNGYYRCSIKVTSANSPRFGVCALDNTSSYTGNGTSGIYIFGAQLSDSASLDPYVLNAAAAPTAAAYYGPRFDYDPVTLLPKGLLIEEQRTNLLVQSSNFSTTWTTLNSTVTGTSGTSPDGTNNAFYITDDTTSGLHYVGQTYTTTAAAHTFSAYAKKGTANYVGLYVDGKGVFFNLNTGAFSSNIVAPPTSYEITPVGNGWYRLSIVVTLAAALQSFRIMLSQDGSSYSYVGSGKNALIYGSQVEIGSFATSYIPTAASQVTRAADVATIQGSNFYSWYNQNEGSVYANYIVPPNLAGFPSTMGAISDGTTQNFILMYAHTTGLWSNITALNAVQFQAQVLGAPTVGANAKQIVTYKINDAIGSVGGQLTTQDTSVNLPIVNQFKLGTNGSGSSYINGIIKQISYYPQRLSNDVLKGLTA